MAGGGLNGFEKGLDPQTFILFCHLERYCFDGLIHIHPHLYLGVCTVHFRIKICHTIETLLFLISIENKSRMLRA